MITEAMINKAYAGLVRAQLAYSDAARAFAESKSILDAKVARATVTGVVTGTNDKSRLVSAMEVYAEDFQATGTLEGIADEAKFHLTLAQIEVERVRLLMRYAELQAGISRATSESH